MSLEEIIHEVSKELGGAEKYDDYGNGFQDGIKRAIQIIEHLQVIYGDD